MNIPDIITAFKDLGPAVAAVLVMGVLCSVFVKVMLELFNKLITLFEKHDVTLVSIQAAMTANTEETRATRNAIDSYTEVTKANMELTQGIADFLKHLNQPPK